LDYLVTGSGKLQYNRYTLLFGYSFQEALKHPTSVVGSIERPGYMCIKEGRSEGFLQHHPTVFMTEFFYVAANLAVPIATSGYNPGEWKIHQDELVRLSQDASLKSTLRAHYMELKLLLDLQMYTELLNDRPSSPLQSDGPKCSVVDISLYLTDTTRLRLSYSDKQKFYPTLRIAIDLALSRRDLLLRLFSGVFSNALIGLIQSFL
jgi:hypothetical protein